MAIVIKRPGGIKLLLQASNAAQFPAPTVAPLNVDYFFRYKDDNHGPQYIGTFPVGKPVQIPLATDLDRDIVITTRSRGPIGQQQVNDIRDAPSLTVQSEREQRQPVIGQMGASTYLKAIIGVSYFPRHMKTRRILIATDEEFEDVVAEWYQDIDREELETPRLSEQFSIQRLSPTSGTATYYIKVAHASFSTAIAKEATYQAKLEGLRWGPDSEVLEITLADNNGDGGSSGAFNPFTATFQGYGSGASNLLFSVPMPGDNSGGVTGTSNGFADQVALWEADDTLSFRLGVQADRPRGMLKANGFTGTVGAINAKVDYRASGSSTATTGNMSSGSNVLIVPSSTDFFVDHGITVAGAGVSGATLYSTVQSISTDGLTITLNHSASSSVTGAAVNHDDTVAIQAAIDAAESSSDRAVMLPRGTYRLRSTLTANGEVRIYGESKFSTVLYSTANEPIVTLGKNTSTYHGPIVENLTIRGDVSAGSAQIGLKADDIEYMFMVGVRNVRIEDCGGVGLFVGRTFASSFVDLYISNCAGYPLVYDAQNMPANYFRRVDVGILRDSAPVCYRIKAGYFFGQALNATYGLTDNCLIGLVGRKSGVDGDVTNNHAVAVWDSCNFESYTLGAVHHYYSSRSIFRGVCTFAAQASIILDPAGVSSGATTITANSTNGFPSSGKIQMELETISYTSKNSTQFLGCTRGIDGTTAASHPQYTIVANKQVMPLKYEMDTISSYPALVIRGTIDDNCNFNDGPELRYKDNQAVHSNAIPPLMTNGRGPGASNEQPPIGTYYNTTSGTIEALQRADGHLKRITVEDTKVFSDQGVRWIEVNNTSGGPIDITLPPPNLIKTQELLIVKDVAGNASTHNISIYGGGGAPIEGAGVFTLTKDNQSAIFISNEADTVTGSWRLIAVNPPPGGVTTVGGGTADFIPIYTDDDTITSGPLYRIGGTTIVSKDSLVAETDNVRDIGGDGFNRFRDIFASRKMKAPAFVTPGANGLYGGSGDPEGVETAEPGSIYLRTNGSWYRKVSGSSNTGWVLQGGSVTASGSGLADFIAFFSSDSNITSGPIYKSGTTTIFKGSAVPETNNSYDLGSASLKWRSGYFGTKVQTVTYEFTDGLTVSAGSGSPEGVLTANPGSLYLDEGGTLYRKASGFSDTGWVLVGTITALTGDVTASGAGSVTTTIANDAVTFAKMQNISSSKLLGRYSGGSGDVQEITISTGLNLDGSGNLTVTGGGANAALSNLASVAINTTLLPASNNSLDHGSASLKWRSGYFGTKVQTVVYEFTDGLTISTGAGSPEGVVSAPLGSMYLDNSAGTWYRKASGFSTTGWTRGDVSAGANTALSNIASVAIPVSLVSDTDNADDLGSTSINWRDGFFGRDLTVKRRVIGGGSVPSSSTGTGAGTSPSVVVDGSQLACFVSLTTGSSPATNAKVFDLTLSAAPNYYIAMLTPVNAAAKALSGNQQVFISDADATSSKVTIKSGSTGLAGSTTYDWYVTLIAV